MSSVSWRRRMCEAPPEVVGVRTFGALVLSPVLVFVLVLILVPALLRISSGSRSRSRAYRYKRLWIGTHSISAIWRRWASSTPFFQYTCGTTFGRYSARAMMRPTSPIGMNGNSNTRPRCTSRDPSDGIGGVGGVTLPAWLPSLCTVGGRTKALQLTLLDSVCGLDELTDGEGGGGGGDADSMPPRGDAIGAMVFGIECDTESSE